MGCGCRGASENGARRIPRHFKCPISLDLIRDPVMVFGSGNTYERACIETWLGHKREKLARWRRGRLETIRWYRWVSC